MAEYWIVQYKEGQHIITKRFDNHPLAMLYFYKLIERATVLWTTVRRDTYRSTTHRSQESSASMDADGTEMSPATNTTKTGP